MNRYLQSFNQADTIKRKLDPIKGPVSRQLAKKINQAAYQLLEDIHQEIFEKKSPLEKQAILADREQLVEEFFQSTQTQSEKKAGLPAPELTDDYLRELGIDPNNLGSNKVPEGAKLLITDDIE